MSFNIFMNIIYKYILVFINYFIKIKHLVLITFMKVKEAINCFYVHVWKHHDLSEFFMSDQDTQFIFKVWKHLCRMLKINVKLFIIYHSEINNQIERINAVMKHYLWIFINYMQNNSIKWLSKVEFIINNTSSLITLVSFFLINLNQNSRLNFKLFKLLFNDITSQVRDKLINVKEFIKKMKKLTQHLCNEMLIIQIIYKINVNCSHHSCFKYFIEDEI